MTAKQAATAADRREAERMARRIRRHANLTRRNGKRS